MAEGKRGLCCRSFQTWRTNLSKLSAAVLRALKPHPFYPLLQGTLPRSWGEFQVWVWEQG